MLFQCSRHLCRKPQNNNLSNSLQYVHTAENPFDFNDTNTPAGFHRINDYDSFKNPPADIKNVVTLNYGNIFVCRSNKNSDTLSMTFYPSFNNTIFMKTANAASWEGQGWIQFASKSDLEPVQKGSVFPDNIGSLSSPSQLKHPGFYAFPAITSEVNADAGTETMTEYATGDFYGVLIGKDTSADNGCRYGTLILTSPRIYTGIWICTIWEYKFIHWYKIGKS